MSRFLKKDTCRRLLRRSYLRAASERLSGRSRGRPERLRAQRTLSSTPVVTVMLPDVPCIVIWEVPSGVPGAVVPPVPQPAARTATTISAAATAQRRRRYRGKVWRAKKPAHPIRIARTRPDAGGKTSPELPSANPDGPVVATVSVTVVSEEPGVRAVLENIAELRAG